MLFDEIDRLSDESPFVRDLWLMRGRTVGVEGGVNACCEFDVNYLKLDSTVIGNELIK